mmetsp:Transcript_55444/g.124921  ORF Transcript_55444/g.124921 Transcript_55444/m.124921 type:complete len:279 (-) Transcript_55444:96-932(-)
MAEQDGASVAGIPLSAFTWTPTKAHEMAMSQTGASNCGATALMNVLAALEVPLPDMGAAEHAVRTNPRKHGVSASQYLAARSVAGTTAEDIVSGCGSVAGGAVESRFFAFYPPREVELQRWLAGWLTRGCSGMATLNTQRMYGADYWHHQMIFGVDENGVSVTNGIDVLGFDGIMKGLESPSVLQILARDALGCKPFDAASCDGLGEEWARLGVSQQLAELESGASKAKYVYIPAAYRAGITIFAKSGTPEAKALREAPELPLSAAEPEGATAGTGES